MKSAVYTVEFDKMSAIHIVADSLQEAIDYAKKQYSRETMKAARETIPWVYIAEKDPQ